MLKVADTPKDISNLYAMSELDQKVGAAKPVPMISAHAFG